MAETGARQEPIRGYNFRLEIGSAAVAHFTHCVGLGVDISVIKYREAGNRQIVRKLAGQVDYTPVTLSYGLTDSLYVYNWMLTGIEGHPERRDVSIVFLDTQGTTDMARYDLGECWVASFRAANLDAVNNTVAIESISVVYETLKRGGGGRR